MLKFTKLKKNALPLKKYFEQTKTEFCDISVGVRFLWRDDFKVSFAIYNDTLILKESTKQYKNAYYYPMGADEEGALEKIFEQTIKQNKPLIFCCLTEEIKDKLLERFKGAETSLESYFDRDWSDYIYDAKEFSEFLGKKYSGQRNHINKFKKTYPNFVYKRIEKADYKGIKHFLKEYNKGKDFRFWTERDEKKRLFEYVKNLETLENDGAILKVDGKVVALTCGEKIKNAFIVHVEKALTKYSGVYPTMANLFIKDVINKGFSEINREEDCGDVGLRTSKLQYHPKEIRNKYFVKIQP